MFKHAQFYKRNSLRGKQMKREGSCAFMYGFSDLSLDHAQSHTEPSRSFKAAARLQRVSSAHISVLTVIIRHKSLLTLSLSLSIYRNLLTASEKRAQPHELLQKGISRLKAPLTSPRKTKKLFLGMYNVPELVVTSCYNADERVA
jgi:hypothetical protein